MLKTITLKLTNLKHSGGAIGDDVRIEISVLNNLISVDKKIKKNQSITCQDVVGQFFSDGKIFSPEIKITVIEKDLIYNDIGSVSEKLKIDLEKIVPQIHKYQVEVFEKRGKKVVKNKKAIFEAMIETVVGPVIGYAPETKDGWLVVLDKNDKEISIPAYLKVKIERRESAREYFTVLEGSLRGEIFSVKYLHDTSVFIADRNPHAAPARATYSILKKILTLSGKKYQTTDYEGVPWVKGLYDIEIPDFPHPGGLYYQEAKYPTVWFRVGHSGERYLHTGRHSLGCITVLDQKKWGEIYSMLIKARRGDGASVGILEVIE